MVGTKGGGEEDVFDAMLPLCGEKLVHAKRGHVELVFGNFHGYIISNHSQ